jgi:alanine-glyoxylate transaminase / serine-glyoxylate transaminase / serine-pyruvate transaminase
MEHYDPRKLPELPELMIAGPGELHEEDLDVLGHQVIAHYGAVWTELHEEAVAAMGELLGAADPPYIIPGSGTTCLDAAVFNLFEPGQRVVVPRTGFFGTRLMEIAEAHRLEVIEVPVEAGAAVDPAAVREAVSGADGVLCVHVETATGVRHPVEPIAAAAHDVGAACMIDGIASVGGELLHVDDMGIDCLVTGSQKGLEAPPGLGILALGRGGRARVEARSRRPETFYLDLKRWDWYRKEWGEWHPHPVTMPTNLVLALASSLQRILEAGLDAWIARRASLAAHCRKGLIDLGLKPVPHEGVEANLVVAFWADDPAAIQGHLMMNDGLMISGGLEPTAGKAIRIGLMGRTATTDTVDRLISGVRGALES